MATRKVKSRDAARELAQGSGYQMDGEESPAQEFVQATAEDLGKAASLAQGEGVVLADQTLAGGAYIVNGRWVNAAGASLDAKEVEVARELHGKRAADAAELDRKYQQEAAKVRATQGIQVVALPVAAPREK